MTSFLSNLNTTFDVAPILRITEETFICIVQLFTTKNETISRSFVEIIAFDDFQIKILKVLLSVLICNLLIISILWQFCGRQICDRFTRPATSRAIEELKASVARLKLPKVHSPRI